MSGPPGPPGPPGDSRDLHYDLASLLAAQGTSKGPLPLGDEPARIFNVDLTEENRRKIVKRSLENLEASIKR